MSPSRRDERKRRTDRVRRSTDAAKGRLNEQDPDAVRRQRARTRHRRTVASRLLFMTGVLVALQHFAFHLAGSPGALSDVLVGYPTAGAFLVAGAAAIPTSSSAKRR